MLLQGQWCSLESVEGVVWVYVYGMGVCVWYGCMCMVWVYVSGMGVCVWYGCMCVVCVCVV